MKKTFTDNPMEYIELYRKELYSVNGMSCDGLDEDMGKLGEFACASYLLQGMRNLMDENPQDQSANKEAVLAHLKYMMIIAKKGVSSLTFDDDKTILDKQFELYKLKNRRYGNSFSECFREFGMAYALGHIQEKINRICALLVLGEEDCAEPLSDSFRDLLGYCVLTKCEVIKAKEHERK